MLRKARNNAIRTGRDTVVTFDLDQNMAAFGNEEDSLAWSDAVKITAVIAESERVDSNRGNIRFFGNGGSTGGKLHLRTSKLAYDVSVDWLLGTVEVKKSDA
ncbi:GspH/FimT family protein [Hyphomonas sp.]|uniref:GspH/FimT family protein n=1 Tax=Hyphomonas sp. TaxID=87 RepID=UPI0035282F6C